MSLRIKVFFILLVIGVVGMLAYKYVQPYFFGEHQRITSDAAYTKGSIKVGVDNWIGYFILCSPQMRQRMRGAGYLLECVDDKADYGNRFKNLKNGDLQFAVATVDSYLLNGKDFDYPGTIISVIDESKGGDAIVAHESKIASLDDLKKKSGYKVAFTPQSPSEHLLKSISVHFDIPQLLRGKKWRVETDGSEEALDKLQSLEVDAAVLWEPDVTRALELPGVKKILGTESTAGLIVDILLVSRDFSQDQPEAVSLLLANYFRALKNYQSDQQMLYDDVKDRTRLDQKKVKSLLNGVEWVNLYNNSTLWFAIKGSTSKPREGVISAIESTLQVLKAVGDFKRNPIPQSNPYYLQNRSFIEELFNDGMANQFAVKNPTTSTAALSFSKLSREEWNKLREVGTLKIRPITFQSGTKRIDDSGREQLSEASENLEHYPKFRVVVKGHTGLRGDGKANLRLSQSRAEAVRSNLIKRFKISPNRIQAVGLGSRAPLPRRSNESDRAYNYRLPRVELYLVNEVY